MFPKIYRTSVWWQYDKFSNVGSTGLSFNMDYFGQPKTLQEKNNTFAILSVICVLASWRSWRFVLTFSSFATSPRTSGVTSMWLLRFSVVKSGSFRFSCCKASSMSSSFTAVRSAFFSLLAFTTPGQIQLQRISPWIEGKFAHTQNFTVLIATV